MKITLTITIIIITSYVKELSFFENLTDKKDKLNRQVFGDYLHYDLGYFESRISKSIRSKSLAKYNKYIPQKFNPLPHFESPLISQYGVNLDRNEYQNNIDMLSINLSSFPE